jgi:hypothetical protein
MKKLPEQQHHIKRPYQARSGRAGATIVSFKYQFRIRHFERVAASTSHTDNTNGSV